MLASLILSLCLSQSSSGPSTELPIRGLHISAPSTASIPTFVKFVREALPKEGINTLVLELDYRFQFKKHPEIASSDPITKEQMGQIAAACKDAQIHLVPQVNLLGHQSWAESTESLLRAHPEFDETPGKYPNNKGIYCRSYCPNAPGLHKVIFDSIDEICDAAGSDAFHCGMDEVFILADKDCKYCKGKTASQVFASEVNALHDHLKGKGLKMWMWGDRFLDGRSNGLGEWEASINGTWDTITKVPKDIVICDWHYEHCEPTPAYFAMNGFPVLFSPWRDPQIAVQQLAMIQGFRSGSNSEIANKVQGFLHTTWCGAEDFINTYYGKQTGGKDVSKTVETFKALCKAARE